MAGEIEATCRRPRCGVRALVRDKCGLGEAWERNTLVSTLHRVCSICTAGVRLEGNSCREIADRVGLHCGVMTGWGVTTSSRHSRHVLIDRVDHNEPRGASVLFVWLRKVHPRHKGR